MSRPTQPTPARNKTAPRSIQSLGSLSAFVKGVCLGRIMTAVERVRVDSETNLADILDRVHRLSIGHIDDTHFFTLSQVYEDLLLKMGEKNSDGGQFFTPREVIRAMVLTLDPAPGETVYDPCCGTGGFLAEAFGHMARKLGDAPAATEIERLKHDTFPPFGGKEGDDAQQRFPFRTGAVLDDDQLPDTLLRLLAEGVADSTEDREAVDTTRMPAADTAMSEPFPTFARLLAAHGTADGESPLSWSLDIAARREKAREEMAPHLKEAARQKALAITLRSELAVLRRAKAPDEKIEPIQSRISAAERAAREAQTKADAIDAAVFDLKAVNPRARSDRDNRTPEQVLTAIAVHQRTIDLALS